MHEAIFLRIFADLYIRTCIMCRYIWRLVTHLQARMRVLRAHTIVGWSGVHHRHFDFGAQSALCPIITSFINKLFPLSLFLHQFRNQCEDLTSLPSQSFVVLILVVSIHGISIEISSAATAMALVSVERLEFKLESFMWAGHQGEWNWRWRARPADGRRRRLS